MQRGRKEMDAGILSVLQVFTEKFFHTLVLNCIEIDLAIIYGRTAIIQLLV